MPELKDTIITTKIVIVDDHVLFREGLRLLIEKEEIGEVVAELDNGKQFLDILDEIYDSIILMDIDMPVMNGLEATKKALEKHPDIKILVLSMYGNKNYYNQFVSAGVSGFILKTSGKFELENAICKLSRGGSYFSNELLIKIIQSYNTEDSLKDVNMVLKLELTKRETEVLALLCKGHSITEIANQLFLSNKSIEAYRSRLIEKTNSKNTISLVLYAIKNKLIAN